MRSKLTLITALGILGSGISMARGEDGARGNGYFVACELLQEVAEGVKKGSLKRLAEATIVVAEGRASVYRSGGEAALDGETVPVGVIVRAEARQAEEGQAHLKLRIEHRERVSNSGEGLLVQGRQVAYSGVVTLGKPRRVLLGAPSGRRIWLKVEVRVADVRERASSSGEH